MRKAIAFTVLFACLTGTGNAETIKGPATAVDGRTLDMTGTPFRLAYIDAPELQQTCEKNGASWLCGEEAKDSLSQIIEAEPVTCMTIGKGADGIDIARCETRTFDLGREMVRRGLAIALNTAPSDYSDAVQIAQSLHFGIWEGEFEQPAQWRAAHPDAVHQIFRTVAAQAEPARSDEPMRAAPVREQRYTDSWGCAIKGNRSRRGEWIYHLPGQYYYEVTRPEDLFCTEREAQAAGYRRSKI